jgi:hypothetical protein
MAFKYQPLTKQQLEKRLDQKTQIIDPSINPKFQVFRPKVGLNTIRFLPPTWQGFEHWALDAMTHMNIGPDNGSYLCLNRMLRQPCPICEERKSLDDEGDSEAAKQIYARKRRVAWIIDRNEDEPTNNPKIWIYGYTIDEDIAGRCFNRKTGAEIDILHPDEGFDVTFRRGNEKPFPKTTQIEIDREPSPIDSDQAWQEYYLNFITKNPVPDVLQYYEYDHIYNVLHGRSGRRPTEHSETDGEEGVSARHRVPPPSQEADEAPEPQVTRSRASASADPNDDEARTTPSESGNGHSPTEQARQQIRNLRSEQDARGEAIQPPRGRVAPPVDDSPPPRRRPAPPA